ASSKQPKWVEHNAHFKLLQLFNEYDANNNTKNASPLQLTASSKIPLPSLPAWVYVATGIISYLSSYNRDPLYENSKKELDSILSAYENQSVQNDDLFVEKIEPERIGDCENNEKHIIIQFGDSCKSTSSSSQRYEYTAYVKCKTKNLIDSVSFDINPEYPKSAVRVSEAPYELVRIMHSEFTCDFIIQWNKVLNWPKLRITYHVRNKQNSFTRNLLLRVPNQGNTMAKSHKTREDVVYNWTDRDRTKPNINYVVLFYD
ncbi:unnamed protein product, partial [Rotaria sp. Silwood2]